MRILMPALFSIAAVGCSQLPIKDKATVLPKADGTIEIIGTAAREGRAYENTEFEAKKACKAKGKSYVVVSHSTVYQGVDKESKTKATLADAAFAYASRGTNKRDRSDDYKTTMVIRCQ